MKKYLIVVIICSFIPTGWNNQDSAGEFTKTLVESAIDYALDNPEVPVKAKIAVAAGKAFLDGKRTFQRTGSFVEAGKKVISSGVESTSKAVIPSTLSVITKTGVGLAKDILQNKSAVTSLIGRVEEAAVDSVLAGHMLELNVDQVNQRRANNGIKLVENFYSKIDVDI